MLRTENTETYGWKAAIRGMRNPMNSWDKSDSLFDWYQYNDTPIAVIGDNDYNLMEKLVSAGTDHSKFMRMITVTVDIVAPLYWWKEFDTYKVGTVANSCSTMHKIHENPLTLDDFSHEHLDDLSLKWLDEVIVLLNAARESYTLCKKKSFWWQMIQLLPASFNQRRTVQLNYAVLRNIYKARHNHKLDEWHTFCDWIEDLPHSELITTDKNRSCLDKYRTENSSTLTFLEECCVERPKKGKKYDRCSKPMLYKVYIEWCKTNSSNGYRDSKRNFKKAIESVGKANVVTLHGTEYYTDFTLTKEAKKEFSIVYGSPD